MVHNFTRTIALDISGFPASTNRNVIASAIANRFQSLKVTALQLIGNTARVSFADTASKDLIMRMESVNIGDVVCSVKGGGPRPQRVFVHNYPFEASADSLAFVMRRYGEVKDISYRRWLHMNDIYDGVRIVTMIRAKSIPRNLEVDGFHIKVSYYGQAVECDICNNYGHVARDCPLKGKCLWCHQSGHLQRDCTNPRAGEGNEVVSSVEVPPNDTPVIEPSVTESSVNASQASGGDPCGQPSGPMTAESQPLFQSVSSVNEVNDSSNSGMENIVKDKPCESQSEINESSGVTVNDPCEGQIQSESSESSSMVINSDTLIESFSSEQRSWAQIVETSSPSTVVSSGVQLSSWGSDVINDVMDLDVDNVSSKSSDVVVASKVPNTRPSKGKVASTPGRSASPATSDDVPPSSSGRPGPRKRARSTPTVANTGIRRSRDRSSHIPVAAVQAAKASLHVPRS